MKRTHVNGRIASVLAAVALLLGGAGIASAQDLSAIQKPGDKGDYLVHVGKQVRWASEVHKERLEATRRSAEATRKLQPTTLTPVLVGKQNIAVTPGQPVPPVVARRSETSVAASSEKPEKPKSRGYFEKRGKATFWIETPQQSDN